MQRWCGSKRKSCLIARGSYAKREDKKTLSHVIKSYWCTSFVGVIAWGRVKSRVFSEVAIFATSENTSDILILNFTTIHCDYLLIADSTKFLNALNCDNRWSRISLSCSSKFASKFLSFAHFLKTFSHHSVLFFLFSFWLLPFNSSIYSLSTISKRDAIVTEKQLDWASCC